MAQLSLFDLACLHRADEYTGLIEDVTTLAEEFATFPAHPRDGTWYTIARRVVLPTAQFRAPNIGTTTSKSTFQQDLNELFFMDIQLLIDEAVWDADEGNLGTLWQLEARGAMQSAAILLGQQTYYGASADARGFAGLKTQLTYNIKAGGTTNSTTAYLLWMDEKEGIRFDVGMNGQFQISDPTRQLVVDPNNSGKTYFAYVGNMKCWVGMNVNSAFSTYGVTGITATQAQWMTDALAAQLVGKIPTARRKNLRWYMNRTSQSALWQSRSTINIGIVATTPSASYQAADAGGRPAFSMLPDSCVGYPIVVTDSLLDTETNS